MKKLSLFNRYVCLSIIVFYSGIFSEVSAKHFSSLRITEDTSTTPSTSSDTLNVILNTSRPSGLPIRLLDFFGTLVSNNTIQTNWVTELEVKNKQFELQRSFDGRDFQTVAIAYSLEESGKKAYKLTDKLPATSPSKVYYRIKQVDLDNKYSISKIITISIEEINKLFVKLSPNPVDNEFSISFENNNTPASAIRIVDMNGREVFRKSLVGLQTSMHRIDTRQANMQKAGMYFAELTFNDGSRSTQKVIKN